MELIDFLKLHSKLSPEMAATVNATFKKEILPKRHQLLAPDNQSKKIFFLENGFARLFYFKEDKDITHYFYGENDFASATDSIFLNRTSPYGLELLEKSTVRTCQYHILEPIIHQMPELQKLERMLLIAGLVNLSDRLHAIQFQKASDSYQIMLKAHPEIFQKAQLGHIASYLGITQQTLSVIRGQKL